MAAYFATDGAAAALGQPDTRFPPVPLPQPPLQLNVAAGDALLAHYLLVHSVSANLGPHIRYAVFFRLFGEGHDASSTASLADLWRGWDGLR
jgi:ectoine hydroxylase-related dioxygenase (phytanoyl-CoA dioxygenase family)